MGLPSINIVFQTVADNSIKMSQKGVVGMILQDPIVEGALHVSVKRINFILNVLLRVISINQGHW